MYGFSSCTLVPLDVLSKKVYKYLFIFGSEYVWIEGETFQHEDSQEQEQAAWSSLQFPSLKVLLTGLILEQFLIMVQLMLL